MSHRIFDEVADRISDGMCIASDPNRFLSSLKGERPMLER